MHFVDRYKSLKVCRRDRACPCPKTGGEVRRDPFGMRVLPFRGQGQGHLDRLN